MHCAVVCAHAGTEKIKGAMGALDLERIAQALEVYGPTAGAELVACSAFTQTHSLQSEKAGKCQIEGCGVPDCFEGPNTLINCCNSEQLQQAILDARELQGFDPTFDTKILVAEGRQVQKCCR